MWCTIFAVRLGIVPWALYPEYYLSGFHSLPNFDLSRLAFRPSHIYFFFDSDHWTMNLIRSLIIIGLASTDARPQARGERLASNEGSSVILPVGTKVRFANARKGSSYFHRVVLTFLFCVSALWIGAWIPTNAVCRSLIRLWILRGLYGMCLPTSFRRQGWQRWKELWFQGWFQGGKLIFIEKQGRSHAIRTPWELWLCWCLHPRTRISYDPGTRGARGSLLVQRIL